MTYVVTAACIGVKDQACMEVCPEFCIYSEDVDDMSFINPFQCTDCGVCAEACTIGAIFAEENVPKELAEFTRLNEQWFGHRTGVRQRIRELYPDAPR